MPPASFRRALRNSGMTLFAAPLLDQLAAAYVLDLLSPRTRRRFEALLPRSARAAQAVREWEERVSALTDRMPLLPTSAPRENW